MVKMGLKMTLAEKFMITLYTHVHLQTNGREKKSNNLGQPAFQKAKVMEARQYATI